MAIRQLIDDCTFYCAVLLMNTRHICFAQLPGIALTSTEWLNARELTAQWFQSVNSSWFDERQNNGTHMAPRSTHKHASRDIAFRHLKAQRCAAAEGHIFFAKMISRAFPLGGRGFKTQVLRECRSTSPIACREPCGRGELDDLAPARGPGYESKIPGA